MIGAALRKSDLPSEETQKVLEGQGSILADEVVMFLRRRIEAISNLITRRVQVVLGRTPEQVLDATGRKRYVDDKVVKTMPRGSSSAKVVFFKLGRYISDDDLEKECELRGLKPADPYSLAAVNEADPAFADDHPNGTHWKDADGKWCYATFDRWDGGRFVRVDRDGSVWDDGWWFAGLRK